MRHSSLVRGAVVATASALVLAACGSDEGDNSEKLTGALAAGGASSQEAAQNAWIVGFGDDQPDVSVTYDPIGSGGGRESFISKAFPFAGSDSYLKDDEGELTAATERCNNEAPIQIPNYVSPIAVIFNVEGVDELDLSTEAVAGIFAGKITTWNDEAIASTNEGVDLPDATINAVHRSDESGTTENFTDYLTAVQDDVWTAGAIEVWPTEFGGEGAKGTSGVVAAVKNGKNSIGYADASQADNLAVANIEVGDEFVGPTAEAAAKILDVSPEAEGAGDTALIFDLDHTTTEAGTYPIVLTSYLIACQSYTGDEVEAGKLTKAYIQYILSDDGQKQGADEAGSAPLSDDLQKKAQDIVNAITAE